MQPILRMKKLFFLLLLLPVFAWSQKTHTVGPKETLFSIGRLYNVHPRELASFNNIPYETGLTIGQVLKIPSKTTMAPLPAVTTPVEKTPTEIKPVEKPIQKPVVKKTEKTATPAKQVAIYHKVQKKENLYQISRMYNKVPVDDLKKWNKLSSDALSEGMNLIVGYKTSGKEPAVTNNEEPVITPVKTEEPAVKKPEVVVEKKEPPKTVKTEEPVKPPVVNVNNNPVDFKGGVFKSLFDSQAKANEGQQEEGTAGVFKSTSGWSDGKYYCLHNTAAAGTIIKITNKATGKYIYAKVLDVIPDIKQNAGLLIRISNAASQELGVAENNFDCILNYSK